jgi:hypothetical protein
MKDEKEFKNSTKMDQREKPPDRQKKKKKKSHRRTVVWNVK